MLILDTLGHEEDIPEEELEEYLEMDAQLRNSYNRFGAARAAFLEEQRPREYFQLSASGTLFETIRPLQEQADLRWRRLIKQMCDKRGVNDDLKLRDVDLWLSEITQIQASAKEIVMAEMIYV